MKITVQHDQVGKFAVTEGSGGNLLLRTLDKDALKALSPHLIPCTFERDDSDDASIGSAPVVLFPEHGILTLLLSNIASACPIALIGREGIANHHLVFPNPALPFALRAQVGGSAMAIETDIMRRLLECMPRLADVFSRFAAQIQLQIASTLRSSLRDSVEQRMVRLLLMYYDRMEGDDIRLLHSEIGGILGVRRATVTDALHRLEEKRGIRSTRARIKLRDRCVLEEIAGSSYGVAEALQAPALPA